MNNIYGPANISQVREMYSHFQTACINRSERIEDVRRDFLKLNSKFYYNDMQGEFLKKASRLCDRLIKEGELGLANIILSEIGKILVNKTLIGPAEKIISKSIEINEKFDDKIHILARLTDLEILYKKAVDCRKNIRKNTDKDRLKAILERKIECAMEILENYEKYLKNFNSVNKNPATKKQLKVQVSRAYTDIAYIIAPENPNSAIEYLLKAKGIYDSLNMKQEAEYIAQRIRNTREAFC